MNKKILMGLGAALAVVASVAAMSAYEAHVINVTAHIENALAVSTEAIEFGTVFPQESLERDFTVRLSDSFMYLDQTRVRDVNYKIVQKPKCECIHWDSENSDELALCGGEQYAQVDYWDPNHGCPEYYAPMLDLCRFLSKLGEQETNHVSVPSYYNVSSDTCSIPDPDMAQGYLFKCYPEETCSEDTMDCWTVDLKVPPVEGYVGQDWPESCTDWIVPTDGADYGCDLWIEVTGFSFFTPR